MSALGERLRQFGREFKRRRVGKVTLGYLAASWLIIEVTSVVFPELAVLPDWASRAVILIAIGGLPVVFIVAWIFDLTPEGVVRTAPLPRHRIAFRQQPKRLVGRESVLATLSSAYASLEDGRGQFFCLAGEPGMGKSTVLDAFVERIREDDSGCLIGNGRSSERHGETSAYMPLIEALSELVNTDQSGTVARAMARCSPSWHALVFPQDDKGTEAPGVRANSQGRLQHELGLLLAELCARQKVVLCFDDFHWVDVSTLDALVYLADRLEGLGLFLLVSFRESELRQTDHPFVRVRLSLKSHEFYHEIALEPWDVRQLHDYLRSEFPEHRFPEAFPSRIFERTGGNPLFVVELIRYLKDGATLVEEAGAWRLSAPLEAVSDDLPGSIKSMIERKMSRLDEDDWRLLGAASVQGQRFDSAVLASMLGMDAADIEERLERVERVHGLVKLISECEMPDRTLSSRYQFAHILYQGHLQSNLRPSRKVSLARAAADALMGFHSGQREQVASELAHLFAMAREPESAASHYLTAAINAARLFAYREAASMARNGLAVMAEAGQSPVRDHLELMLQLALGRSLCMTDGYGSKETMDCFARALELTRSEAADGHQDIDLLWSLWMVYTNIGNREMSRELSERLQRAASEDPDTLSTAAAQLAAGFADELGGSLQRASDHFQQVIDAPLIGSSTERASRFVADPMILARGSQLRVLALMARVDACSDRWKQNQALIEGGTLDPRSEAGLMIEGAWYHAFFGRFDQASELTERTLEICKKFDFFMEGQWASFVHGWAATQLGELEQGLAGMAGFIGFVDTTGALMHAPLYYAVYADVLVRQGRIDDARPWIERGLEVIARTGQAYYASEIHRVQGDIAAADADRAAARRAFEQARNLARSQGARLLELRAALALNRLLTGTEAEAEGLQLLRETAEQMPDGFASQELQKAGVVLQAAHQ